MSEYNEVQADQIPAGLIWCTPRWRQGQIVEVAYADPGSQADPGHDGLYKRVTDGSVGLGETRYYVRTGARQDKYYCSNCGLAIVLKYKPSGKKLVLCDECHFGPDEQAESKSAAGK